MIVYVESNFILELVRFQDEAEACSEILGLAAAGRIRLVVPAFSVAEPFDVVRRATADRHALRQAFDRHLRLLARTTTYRDRLAQAADIAALLTESSAAEADRLHDVLARVLDVAEVIPVNAETLRDALRAQREMALVPQDAVVFASVRRHAESADGAKCFLQRDAKDFVTPGIEQILRERDCRIISSFRGGRAFVLSHLELEGS
jgi:predicted nucleic acid-binding protein